MRAILLLLTLLITIPLLSAGENENGTPDSILGSKLYSRHNLYLLQSVRGGMSGSKDHLQEDLLISFRFRSKNRHAFSLRTYHMGYGAGLFSGNMEKFNFGVLFGFEYLFKAFARDSGIILFLDAGFCNWGFALNTGVGLGDRFRNGIFLSFTYLYNSNFHSLIDFNFLIGRYFALRGNLGIDINFTPQEIKLFNFYAGVFPGVAVNNRFRFELGGGVTVNDYFAFRWFVGGYLTFSFDV